MADMHAPGSFLWCEHVQLNSFAENSCTEFKRAKLLVQRFTILHIERRWQMTARTSLIVWLVLAGVWLSPFVVVACIRAFIRPSFSWHLAKLANCLRNWAPNPRPDQRFTSKFYPRGRGGEGLEGQNGFSMMEISGVWGSGELKRMPEGGVEYYFFYDLYVCNKSKTILRPATLGHIHILPFITAEPSEDAIPY